MTLALLCKQSPCPLCGAAAGVSCQSLGTRHTRYVQSHQERITVARELAGKPKRSWPKRGGAAMGRHYGVNPKLINKMGGVKRLMRLDESTRMVLLGKGRHAEVRE